MYDIYYVSTPFYVVSFSNMPDAVSAVALVCSLFGSVLITDDFLKSIYNGLFCSGEWSCYGVSVRGVWL